VGDVERCNQEDLLRRFMSLLGTMLARCVERDGRSWP
jgi:hypothetical protein